VLLWDWDDPFPSTGSFTGRVYDNIGSDALDDDVEDTTSEFDTVVVLATRV